MKSHLNRLATPRTWLIQRKERQFVTRPKPGSQPLSLGLPLSVVFKDLLGVAHTTREVRRGLLENKVTVDGTQVKDHRRHLAFMDVVTPIKESYRMIVTNKGKIGAVKVDDKEAGLKMVRVNNKTMLKGKKMQLNTNDGRSIIVAKDEYKVGDGLLLEVPSQKIKSHFKLDKDAYVIIMGGNHMGYHGKVLNIFENKIMIQSDKEKLTTDKRYAFVLGKGKPEITFQ